jgi:hypothetical protein
MSPHQQRVVDEHRELRIKLAALAGFIDSSTVFPTLDALEQTRLRQQELVMDAYADILAERIGAFNGA